MTRCIYCKEIIERFGIQFRKIINKFEIKYKPEVYQIPNDRKDLRLVHIDCAEFYYKEIK